MLTPPADLAEGDVVRALEAEWELDVESITYAPVGFGSHHWEVVDRAGTRWFATVDEGDAAAAFATAVDLRAAGCGFVVAPVPTAAGAPLVSIGRFTLVLHPWVDGERYDWGEFSSPAHRQSVIDRLVALHAVDPLATPSIRTDTFEIPHRAELGRDGAPDCGPYAAATADLLARHRTRLDELLTRYDTLVAEGHHDTAVVTHGEPHAGNTIRVDDGWCLVDWDTVMLAPRERDLWSFGPDDRAAYEAAAGVALRPARLELYRVRWDLADIAVYVHRFRQDHTGNADDDKSWAGLCALVGG